MAKSTPADKTIIDILKFRKEEQPDNIAYTFLIDGYIEQNITNAVLAKEAMKIAYALKQICAPGDRVILFFAPGLDFITAFYGCLIAGIVAVPSIPPQSKRSLSRLGAIIENAKASVILTHTQVLTTSKLEINNKYNIINVDDLSFPGFYQWPDVNEDSLAFLQYTSGSTGLPKGVMISHKNIRANVNTIKSAFEQNEHSIILGWLPLYHDMGLVGSVFVPMFVGVRSIMMSPLHFSRTPVLWFKAITKYKVTTTGGPNFGFDHCLHQIKEKELDGCDLSSWKIAFVGAEPVREKTLLAFSAAFAAYGFNKNVFRPCYGMAEATLLISVAAGSHPIKAIGPLNIKEKVVCCGQPVDMEVVIVDEMMAATAGKPGEIWIRGENVSKGYWHNEEVNKTHFNAFLSNGSGPFFRTGDIGFIKDNELYITGRIKDLIIINGKNYYAHDIETLINENVDEVILNGTACFSIIQNDLECIFLILEVATSAIDSEKIFTKVRELVFLEFEVFPTQIYVVRKGVIPRTTSGKIQRSACQDIVRNKKLSIISEWQSSEKKIITDADVAVINADDSVHIFSQVTKILDTLNGKPTEGAASLFSLNLSSIKLAQLTMLLEEEFNVSLDIEYIFSNPTIKDICLYISQLAPKKNEEKINISVTSAIEYFELSHIQHGIWFDQQLKPDSNCYNIFVSFAFEKKPDKERLEAIFNEIISEFDILRATFHIVDDKPVQRINSTIKFRFDELNTGEPKHGGKENHIVLSWAAKLFDISAAPLFRASLIQNNADDGATLFLTAHHLILDGTSLFLLAKELSSRYYKQGISNLNKVIQYKDYLHSSHISLMQEARDYWIKKFSDEFQPFHLREDILADTRSVGSTITMILDHELANAVHAMAGKYECTDYMVLLAAFCSLMHRRSSRADVIIGVPVTGRTQLEVQNMLGTFINAIMLKVQFHKNSTCIDILKIVKKELIHGIKHQAYPLHILAKDLNISNKNPGRQPFTSVFFNGLTFFDSFENPEVSHSFEENPGLDMNVELNVYVLRLKDGIRLRVDYKESLYGKDEVTSLMNEYRNIITDFVTNPVGLVASNKQASTTEEERIRFANGNVTTNQHITICKSIATHALCTPASVALVYKDIVMSFGDLNSKANSLAKRLMLSGIKKNDFIPLLIDKSIELPLTILALMKAGAAFVPMDTKWPLERICALLKSLSAPLVICSENQFTELTNDFSVLYVSHKNILPDAEDVECEVNPDDPIYGMFTSGTTGLPKCAINLHKGILNRFAYMNKVYGCTPDDSILFTSRQIYDASVWQMFWPLTNGAKTVIPEDIFGIDVDELVRLIERYKITITDFVPTVFSIFVDYFDNDEQKKSISTLRQLLIGGEAMNSKSIEKLRYFLPDIGITNTYGPTEASIGTIFYEVPKDIPAIIPIGKPIDNVKALLLNDNLSPVAIGERGELYLGGICIGAGYLNDPQRTAEVFIKNPIKKIESEFLYKTGDIAYYLPDGNIQFVGRKDSQIKINGIRVECGEIENVLLSFPGIKEAIVLCREDSQRRNFLTGVLLSDDIKPDMVGRLQSYLKTRLPAYMIPRGYTVMKELPQTLSGKADKKLLMSLPWENANKSNNEDHTSSATEVRLKEIWSQLLDNQVISVSDSFFNLGGDSLKAMQLQSRIYKTLSIQLSLKDIFFNPTIYELGKIIDGKQASNRVDIQQSAIREYYELSFAQRRIWILSKFKEAEVAYNIPILAEIKGKVDKEAIKKAFSAIFNRHEALRTVFIEKDGLPYQYIKPASPVAVTDTQLISHNKEYIDDYIARQIGKPLDLVNGPLIRAELIATGNDMYRLLVIVHHLVSDAWSVNLLLKELITLYNNSEAILKPLQIHYKDYAVWQIQYLQSLQAETDKKYWLQKLNGVLPVLNLPLDNNRPPFKTYNGSSIYTPFSTKIHSGLQSFCQTNDVTVFATLLSAVYVLMHRYTNEKDIIIGIPVSGRNHEKLEDQVGLFVNTLPIRSSITPDVSFNEITRDVKNTLIDAYEHQMFPFDYLVNELHVIRDPSRNPLFDIMVTLLDQTSEHSVLAESLPGAADIKVVKLPIARKTTIFDLFFNFIISGDIITLELQYNTDLFKENSAVRISSHFLLLLENILNSANIPINQINYLSVAEKDQLINKFNCPVHLAEEQTIISLFKKQVRISPYNIALRCGDTSLTYEEIDRLSDLTANFLLQKCELKYQQVVGIKMERSCDLIIAMLGILKAGATYLPIDVAYPAERVNYMLKETGCDIVFADNDCNLPGCKVIKITDAIIPDTDISAPAAFLSADHIAYIIYTSGSTGRPKGVMITHSNAVSFIECCMDEFKNKNFYTVFAVTSICFDLSVFEIFFSLAAGKTIRLLKSPLDISAFLPVERNILLNTVPSVVENLLHNNECLTNVNLLNMAGEPIPARLLNKLQDTNIEIRNLYGPSETTTYSTSYQFTNDFSRSLIGTPLSNSYIYILDPFLQMLPVGVPGEIYIGGSGVAKGYINDAALTIKKFIKDPFNDGNIIYKTGDMARWHENGNIEFLGRSDHQVKIRGFRIELAEIENCLANCPFIKECIVLCKNNNDNDKFLVGYIVLSDNQMKPGNVEEYLSAYLPSYMVPRQYVLLDQLPVTSNGKINRKALEDIALTTITNSNVLHAPQNHIEEKIKDIWVELLKTDQIGVYDNFFALGGHSLTATQVLSRIRDTYKVDLPFKILFDDPTIAKLAVYIKKAQESGTIAESIPILRRDRSRNN